MALGFAGKQAIHPGQVAAIHDYFRPAAADVQRARRIVQAAASAQRAGVGAIDLDGIAVDRPVVLWAERLLARHDAAGGDGTMTARP